MKCDTCQEDKPDSEINVYRWGYKTKHLGDRVVVKRVCKECERRKKMRRVNSGKSVGQLLVMIEQKHAQIRELERMIDARRPK